MELDIYNTLLLNLSLVGLFIFFYLLELFANNNYPFNNVIVADNILNEPHCYESNSEDSSSNSEGSSSNSECSSSNSEDSSDGSYSNLSVSGSSSSNSQELENELEIFKRKYLGLKNKYNRLKLENIDLQFELDAILKENSRLKNSLKIRIKNI
jgi:hypothetical protein